jgi:hypothetical protein
MEREETILEKHGLIILLVAVYVCCLFFLASQLIQLTGHDYGLALTRLLDTHFTMISHGLSLFEYSPSFCGGVFNFANPNSGSLSLTQLLVYIGGPEIGIKALYITTSMIGGLGIFWCGRQASLGVSAALISAGCFTLSGVFLSKLVVGHLLYYHLLLAPLVAAFVLKATEHFLRGSHLATIVFAGSAAIITALSIYGGVAGFLLPFMASILLLWLMCGALRQHHFKPIALFAFYLSLAAALSAPKIEASLALFSTIGNRDFYGLPGFGFSGLVSYVISGLFLVPNVDSINDSMSNATWHMGWHEIYVGLPQLALIASFIYILRKPASLRNLSIRNYGRFGVFVIFGLLLLPLGLNYYSPSWHRLIEVLPILGDSSNMMRWACLYVPAFAIAVGQLFRNFDMLAPRPAIVIVAMMVTTTWWQYSVINKHLLAEENFDPSGILAQWHSDPGEVLPIKHVGLATNDDGKGGRRAVHAPQFDHMFTKGISNATCYEPVFGYRLETFPISSIRSGEVMSLQNGTYGLINPACYVYPAENKCAPGDRFTATQKELMLKFMERGAFDAKVSSHRIIAEFVASIFAIAIVLIVVFYLLRRWQFTKLFKALMISK